MLASATHVHGIRWSPLHMLPGKATQLRLAAMKRLSLMASDPQWGLFLARSVCLPCSAKTPEASVSHIQRNCLLEGQRKWKFICFHMLAQQRIKIFKYG